MVKQELSPSGLLFFSSRYQLPTFVVFEIFLLISLRRREHFTFLMLPLFITLLQQQLPCFKDLRIHPSKLSNFDSFCPLKHIFREAPVALFSVCCHRPVGCLNLAASPFHRSAWAPTPTRIPSQQLELHIFSPATNMKEKTHNQRKESINL